MNSPLQAVWRRLASRNLSALAWLLAFGLIFSANATASLVITVGEATGLSQNAIVPGGTAVVPFFAHIEGLTPNPLTSYSFTIDLGGDGEGIPSAGATPFFEGFPIGIGGQGGPVSAIGGNFELSNPPGFIELDFIAEWNGAVDLSDNPIDPTLLFELVFDVNAATPPGEFDVVIPTDGLGIADSQTGANSNNVPITDIVFNSGVLAVSDRNTVSGDYNGDGIVNAADYAVWRNSLGGGVTPSGTSADGNSNGVIDAGDFLVWQANFGLTLPPAAGSFSVPEPQACWLVASCLLPFVVSRKGLEGRSRSA